MDLQPRQSHVAVSFESQTANSDALGTLRILEAVRILGSPKKPGSTRQAPVSSMARCRRSAKRHPFYPRSPYGVQLYAYWITVNYRELWDLRLQRCAVQPRESAAGRNICDAQDHARPGAGGCRTRRLPLYGQSRSLRDWGHARYGNAVADASRRNLRIS